MLDITQCEFYKRAVLLSFLQTIHMSSSDLTDDEFPFLFQVQILRLSSQKTVYKELINETVITFIMTL